jgi:hypothetical protein
MFGGLFGLDYRQRVFLQVSQLSPTILTLIFLYLTHDALVTTLSIQLLTFVLSPIIYIKYLSKEREIKTYFFNELVNKSDQIRVGLSGFLGAFVLPFTMYLFIYEFRYESLLSMKIPIVENSPIYIFFLCFFLAIINPILEEIYWRLFLFKTFKDTDTNRNMINTFYVLYQFFVLYYITQNGLSSIVMTFTYFSIGKSFERIKDKFGIISTILTHLGFSLSLMIIMFDIIYLKQHTKSDLPLVIVQEKYFPKNVPLLHEHNNH